VTVLEAILWQGNPTTPTTDGLDTTIVRSPLPGGPAAVARFLFSTVPQWVQIAGAVVAVVAAFLLAGWVWRHWKDILAWIGARSSSWKVGMGIASLAVIGSAGLAGYKTWDFMMHDNAFCTGCHVMEEPFSRFTASEHKKLLCHDCHRQGMLANVRQLYEWVAERPDRIGPHAPVPNAICAECHVKQKADSSWERIAATAGHRVHLNPRSPSLGKVDCVACHGAEVHRFKADETSCAQAGCHEGLRVELGKMAGQSPWHCATCHEFSAAISDSAATDSARASLVPNERHCLECHEMRKKMAAFSPEGDPHKGNCGLCHNPHTHTTPAGAFQSCATSQCHARADTLTPMHRGLKEHRLENCGACHAAHSWKAGATDCRSCHSGIADPAVRPRRLPPPGRVSGSFPMQEFRPAGGVPLGGGIAIVPAAWHPGAEGAKGSERAAGRFRWRPERPAPPPPSDTARFRHAQHATLNCTTCHSTRTAHGELLTQARDCQGCHHADNALGRDCARCHTPGQLQPARTVAVAMALSVWRGPRQRTLPFAHAEHARLDCTDCHTLDRGRGLGKTCSSCHQDHHASARNCTSCHSDSRSAHSRELHLLGCAGSGCHAAERAAGLGPSRAVCLACHTEQRQHKPGRECAQCHLASWPAVAGGLQ
jgi:nitrate/TMAO reductase-like tetraheme cytochrome c subunit